jgi:hypothetical protein
VSTLSLFSFAYLPSLGFSTLCLISVFTYFSSLKPSEGAYCPCVTHIFTTVSLIGPAFCLCNSHYKSKVKILSHRTE